LDIRLSSFKIQVGLLFRKKLFCITFFIFCLFSIQFLNSAIKIAYPENVSLMDVFTYNFNTYSNVFLCYLPLFIILEAAFFSHGKFNEYVMIRYKNRFWYFLHKEIYALKFSFLYRLIENVTVSFIYFVFCIGSNSYCSIISELSKNIQQFMCLSRINREETVAIFCFTFISMLFLELVFSQIIIITSETALSPVASIGIALGADVFLLVIIKCYFWFSGFKISQILPHNNLFLQFIFRDSYISGIESDIHLLVRPMIYQIIVLCILLITMYLYISKRDFLYETVEKNL
jgi:hypothetical protein